MSPAPADTAVALPTEGAASARAPRAGFVLAWCVFWLLMMTVAVQDHLRQGRHDIWLPVFWEGSSMLVSTALVASQWHRVARLDAFLHQPWRWFAPTLWRLPFIALAFVVVVYALRHAVFALLGEVYHHDPWPTVFVYETLKFAIFYLLFVAVVFGIRSHAAMTQERLRAERAQALSQRAQLLQLTQQLEPHFLFNALNTIASTIHSDPDLADALLTKLAALLRAATDLARRPWSTLAEELQLLEGYAAIMRERFAGRLALRFEIDESARGCRVPTLALQPLLENAFRHGVEQHPGPVQIVVSAQRTGSRLRLAVDQDIGTLPAAPAFGVGLSNLQQRLAAGYGETATLSLRPRDGGGVSAVIDLPADPP